MKTAVIDGVEYKLTPIKEESKTYALFALSMPNCPSWNGKWTGSGRLYAITKKAFVRGKAIYPNLKEESHYYDFGDGWGASVKVTFVTLSEARKINKKTSGFCGYDWMVGEILSIGRIKTLKERREKGI